MIRYGCAVFLGVLLASASQVASAQMKLAFKKINKPVKVIDVNYYQWNNTSSDLIYLDASNSPDGAYGPKIGYGNLQLSFATPYGGAKPSTIVTLTLDQPIACRVNPDTGAIYMAGDVFFSTDKVTLMGFHQRSASWNDAAVYHNPTKVEQAISKALYAYNSGQKIFINRVIMAQNVLDNRNDYTGEFTSYPSYRTVRCVLNYDDFYLIGNSDSNQSSWINGVVVNSGGSAPANPVSTNWGFEITTAGAYEVYAHWVANKNTVSNISYAFDGQPATSANLDQNISSGIWVKLGASKTFTVGSHNVTIAVDPTAFYVVDGIKVERVQ
ncbi:hypothetical protein D0C16_22365 [Cellvibrio sp. KY-GH-1]|uniref:golvesin C-terminal-like domain-containing protein n=1 Tax=Cellvibrio sp. KY-GH-1 TaxID=2303332 RepID=UPI00124574E7|nr:hypothetical protein [Cellvibrio sp. KY-GH-1]QEY18479.1 hypothetical protein D0C16_22365 [Cellvibrio sp. KY-GH-1]